MRTARLAALATTIGALALPAALPAGAQQQTVKAVNVGTFHLPVYLTSPPGDRRRQYVVEQNGTIRVIQDGKPVSQPFLDIGSKVVAGGEQGLLGLAFAPDYAKSRLFYVYYTRKSDGADVVAQYRASSATKALASSERTLIAQPDTEDNHNGGQLVFGPDGLLYIGMGDGGGGGDQHGAHGNGQNLGTLLGKILRIDPRRRTGDLPYAIPASNPFTRRSGARPEIYAYGLRNPWRFSFDRRTGAIVIADVGQDLYEEIDFRRKGLARGANFGWRVWEGNHRYSTEPSPRGVVMPVLTHSHKSGFCSITGGYVVRDPKLEPLIGRYVYGDFCQARVRAVTLSQARATGDQMLNLPRVGQITSFGEDAQARVYVLTFEGAVYRLTAAA